MRPEGFELTIHQSAIKPQLVMGIPRQLALVLYTLMAALTFPLGTWYAIPPGIFLHWYCRRGEEGSSLLGVFRRAFLYRHFYRADHGNRRPSRSGIRHRGDGLRTHVGRGGYAAFTLKEHKQHADR